MNKLIIILYLLIAYGSLFPFSFSMAEFSLSKHSWSNASLSGIGDILGNILLFMPLGVAYRIDAITRSRVIFAAKTWFKPLSLALFFALLLQLLQIGIAERDQNLFDVFFNIIGLAIGYFSISALDGKQLNISSPITALPLAIASTFVAAQLIPFVPAIDVQSIINSVKPLLKPPNTQQGFDIFINAVYWLVFFRLIHFWRSISLTYFAVGYIALIMLKILIYSNVLSWAALIAPACAFIFL